MTEERQTNLYGLSGITHAEARPTLAVVDEPTYGNWTLGPEHPTQGIRHIIGLHLIQGGALAAGVDLIPLTIQKDGVRQAIEAVHDPGYVASVLDQGRSSEWQGERFDLANIALNIVGGTLAAMDALRSKTTKVAVNLAGSKHHAHATHGSGFCIFNDFAVAAKIATDQGERVAVFDIDAHHGDGTEALLRDNPNAMTFSVHEADLFPGTGLSSDPSHGIYNVALRTGTGDRVTLLHHAMEFSNAAKTFGATIIFFAAGVDGLARDPLSNLNFSRLDYVRVAADLLRRLPEVPMLVGGAGGYLPREETPETWADIAIQLAKGPRWSKERMRRTAPTSKFPRT